MDRSVIVVCGSWWVISASLFSVVEYYWWLVKILLLIRLQCIERTILDVLRRLCAA